MEPNTPVMATPGVGEGEGSKNMAKKLGLLFPKPDFQSEPLSPVRFVPDGLPESFVPT